MNISDNMRKKKFVGDRHQRQLETNRVNWDKDRIYYLILLDSGQDWARPAYLGANHIGYFTFLKRKKPRESGAF